MAFAPTSCPNRFRRLANAHTNCYRTQRIQTSCTSRTTVVCFEATMVGRDGSISARDCRRDSVCLFTVHPQDPNTAYVLPEDKAIGDQLGGGMRFVTDAKFRVLRTRNGGSDWEPLTKGLPQKNAYLHAMRDGMATD